jgi:eukaryotic-like serine/threonine-protein kinase
MSRVFLAEETALGRKVVVKVLSPELLGGVNIDRFRREIQLVARLQQAQIVPVLSAGETNGVPYYTMPFVEGESLRAKLATEGKLPIPEVVSILRDVTRALTYAHQHGVVHRDIKPDNVLLSGGTAVVTDFGIAKALNAAKDARGTDSALTMLGSSVGTPNYISPEQAAGDPDIDARSDIYSVGCMAYELITGQPPFPDRTPQRALVAHLTEKPTPITQLRPDIPASLADLVMKCLEKDPAARPQTAAELGSALDAVSTGSFSSVAAPMTAKTGVGIYAAAFVGIALLAKAAVLVFGLPEWVFLGALAVMVIGLPAVVLAALGRSSFFTWSRTFRGATIGVGTFAIAVGAIMVLRLFGVGPAASLLAAGQFKGTARLLVVDFTGGKDSSLSHVVTEAVRTNLSQSKVVSIMPPTAIAGALARMQRPANTVVDMKLAQEIAQREGARAVVGGDITPLGAGYVVSLRLVSADSGAELAAYHVTVSGPDKLLDAIDNLTRKLRGRIGESLKSVADAPALDQVTTGSLDALRKYVEANRMIDLTGDYAKAIPLLRDATRLDSNFAMAYRKLGVALNNNSMPRAQTDSALTRAYALRDRLPPKEKYLTIATYYSIGPGLDRQKSIEALQQVIAVDSTDPLALNNLAGNLASMRQYARAESLYHSIDITPRASQQSMSSEMSMAILQGNVARGDSIAQEMGKRFPSSLTVQVLPATLMYMRGQADSSEAFWKARTNDPNVLIKLSALSSLTSFSMLRGKLRASRDLSSQTYKLNEARGVPTNPLLDSLQAASVETWFLEQGDKATHAIDAVLKEHPLSSIPQMQRPYSALIANYAIAGRPDKARAMLAAWDAEPVEPQYRRAIQPARHAVMAEILLAEKKPLEAIKEIWKSDSLPDGPTSQCAHCLDIDLARAYDLANMPDSAIFYWERYLSEPYLRSAGRDAAYLGGIHKRLGELYEAKGDLDKAESHLTAFIDLWKNADPELKPKVDDAKRRLAAIQARKKG